MNAFDRLKVKGGYWRGGIRIRDTGVNPAFVVARLEAGETAEMVLAAYPSLELEDLIQCLRYNEFALKQSRMGS
jgi:uncharacterized protein (DUF433 family)